MDIKKRTQSRVVKVMKGLKHHSPAKKLRAGTAFLEKNKEGFYSCIPILEGKVHRGYRQALSVVSRDRTKGSKHKLKHRQFHVNFLTARVTKQWHSFSKKIVDFPMLEILKSQWTWPREAWFRWHCLSWGIAQHDLGVPFNPLPTQSFWDILHPIAKQSQLQLLETGTTRYEIQMFRYFLHDQ